MSILEIYNPIPEVRKTGYETYKTYCAVKAHFTGTFDMRKYKATTRQTFASFEKRNDKFFFNKLAERYTLRHNYMIFVHNFLDNTDKSVFDLMDQDAIDVYNRRNGSVINALNNYRNDCKQIFEYIDHHNISLNEFFTGVNGSPSVILQMIIRKFISIESFMILDSFLDVINIINNSVPEYDVLWPSVKPKLDSYKKILTIDVQESRNIFKALYNDKHRNNSQ